MKLSRFGLIRSLRAIRDIKKGDEVKGKTLFAAITMIFLAAGQLLHDRGKVAWVVQTGWSLPHFLLFFSFFSSGVAPVDAEDKERRRSDPKVKTLPKKNQGLMIFCQVHWPSVWAARLSDPPARIRRAQCPRTWRSWLGDCARRILDRGGTKWRGSA